jgi:NADPH2:quinone reductase
MDEIAIPFRALLFGSISLHFFLVYDLSAQDRKAAIDGLTALLEQGRLLHAVGQRFRLDDIAAAHEAVEGGKVIGNVLVDLDAA